jgi:hypothetical protein
VTLPCKRIIVVKNSEVKTLSNLAESSKEGCGLKMAVLPVITMVVVAAAAAAT